MSMLLVYFSEVVCYLAGGNSNIFGNVHRENWGRWTHFDDQTFSDGLVETTNQVTSVVANGPASLAGVLPGQRPLGLLRYGNGVLPVVPYIVNYDRWWYFLILFCSFCLLVCLGLVVWFRLCVFVCFFLQEPFF